MFGPRNFILIGLIFAVSFWFLEAGVHTWIFREGPFLHNLYPNSPNEWWMRTLASSLLFGLGAYGEWSRRRLIRAALDQHKLNHELSMAREIQLSMLPREPFRLDGAECNIAASLTPAQEVGGDLFDFFGLADGRGCFLIGDVSGKGIPAALFMARAKSLISLYAQRGDSPGHVLGAVNRELSKDNDACMFVTLFLCFVDFSKGHVMYANAGHVCPYVLGAEGGTIRLADLHGPALGTLEGARYSQSVVTLRKGDLIFMLTDGITEAMNESRDLFGEQRLTEVFDTCGDRVAENVLNSTLNAVQAFTGGAKQFDDISAIAVRLV